MSSSAASRLAIFTACSKAGAEAGEKSVATRIRRKTSTGVCRSVACSRTLILFSSEVPASGLGCRWGLGRRRVRGRPRPGRIREVPASAQGLVELDEVGQARETYLRESVFRREELLLRIEHFDVARKP